MPRTAAPPRTADLQARPYKPGDKVVAVVDLPGVPEGTTGRVAVADGLTWRRYWVRFDNGEMLGHVDQHALVRARDWDVFRHARELERAEAQQAAETTAEADTDAGGAAAVAAGGATVNGVAVPAHLLARSKAARERLGA